jgi:hypothetical protein
MAVHGRPPTDTFTGKPETLQALQDKIRREQGR